MARQRVPSERRRSAKPTCGAVRSRIFLIEDDRKICGFIGSHLRKYGYEVQSTVRFDDVLTEFVAADPQLVLLDVRRSWRGSKMRDLCEPRHASIDRIEPWRPLNEPG